MARDPVTPHDLRGVFAVPPLPRGADAHRTLDLDEAERVARHIAEGGVSRFLYGGNAFLYHVTLARVRSARSTGWPGSRTTAGPSRASARRSAARSTRRRSCAATRSAAR